MVFTSPDPRLTLSRVRPPGRQTRATRYTQPVPCRRARPLGDATGLGPWNKPHRLSSMKPELCRGIAPLDAGSDTIAEVEISRVAKRYGRCGTVPAPRSQGQEGPTRPVRRRESRERSTIRHYGHRTGGHCTGGHRTGRDGRTDRSEAGGRVPPGWRAARDRRAVSVPPAHHPPAPRWPRRGRAQPSTRYRNTCHTLHRMPPAPAAGARHKTRNPSTRSSDRPGPNSRTITHRTRGMCGFRQAPLGKRKLSTGRAPRRRHSWLSRSRCRITASR